jgi:imidazolonepropionase-like amidohydrolase
LIPQTTVVIDDGVIIYVGPDAGYEVTASNRIDGRGRLLTAGLWNSHVHLTSPRLENDAEQYLKDAFLQYGFTTIVDTGSPLNRTVELRTAITSGHLVGPSIIAMGGSFVPAEGPPVYLQDLELPAPETDVQASLAVARTLEAGADGIKIYTGAFQSFDSTFQMRPDVIEAITDAAHTRNAIVYSHPDNRVGVTNAIEHGVDILAHTAPSAGPFSPAIIQSALKHHVALIPTLSLWEWEFSRFNVPDQLRDILMGNALRQLRAFHEGGGEVLFGTDAGYTDVYEPSQEYRLMHAAGMKPREILASLTSGPAQRFRRGTGEVAVGEAADLVLYVGNPLQDVEGFGKIALVIKNGVLVYP